MKDRKPVEEVWTLASLVLVSSVGDWHSLWCWNVSWKAPWRVWLLVDFRFFAYFKSLKRGNLSFQRGRRFLNCLLTYCCFSSETPLEVCRITWVCLKYGSQYSVILPCADWIVKPPLPHLYFPPDDYDRSHRMSFRHLWGWINESQPWFKKQLETQWAKSSVTSAFHTRVA